MLAAVPSLGYWRSAEIMGTASSRVRSRVVEYPESDGKPMAETPVHRNNMANQIDTLSHRYAAEANVYVSGNMMMYYVEGNPRKHVSPDVFVVFGIPKLP